jgi:hypothetical protein
MALAGDPSEQEPGHARATIASARFHIPRPAARTLREFVFQIATIIAGILIALWVDNLVEVRRERALVRNAHMAIAREIGDNLRALRGSLPSLEAHEGQLANGLRFADDLLKRSRTDIRTLSLSLQMPSLNRASWQTAERTGALGYMGFADVKAYAEIYDLQAFVVESQRQQVARLADVTARVFAGEGGDPTRMRPLELEALRARLLDAVGSLKIHKDLASQLLEAYEQAPKR